MTICVLATASAGAFVSASPWTGMPCRAGNEVPLEMVLQAAKANRYIVYATGQY